MTKWSMRPAKTQISLHICILHSLTRVFAVHYKDSQESKASACGQRRLGQLPSLIRVFAVCTGNFAGFAMLLLKWIWWTPTISKQFLRSSSTGLQDTINIWATSNEKTCLCHVRTKKAQISLHSLIGTFVRCLHSIISLLSKYKISIL